MQLKELISILKIATADGAGKALSVAEHLKDKLTRAEAYRRYGRSNVDRWLCEGILKTSGKYIDRLKLESIAESSNRITYLPVAER